MKDDIIAGLDIGSTSIRLVIGQKISGPTGDELQIIGAVSGPTAGVNRGIVNSIEETTSSISAVLEKAERLVGVPINRVWVGINDTHIKFSCDNQSDVKDPIGMNGIRLEVETLIVQGLSTQIKNLTKAIYRTGLEIEDLVLAPLAASEAVISSKQKELGVALINLGSSTTSLAVYEERNLIHTAVLPIGAEHITSDVAIGLRCPINLAERVKKEYGSAILSSNEGDDDIDISELVKEEEVNDDIDTISKKYVSEIISARVEEIFEKIGNEFKKIDRSGMLPAGVIFVGGGSDLVGLVEAAKKKLRLPAAIGVAKNINVVIDKVKNPDFLIALGLVIWGDNISDGDSSSSGKIKKNLNGLLDKTKGFFNRILPKSRKF